jgi:hypothetical protein
VQQHLAAVAAALSEETTVSIVDAEGVHMQHLWHGQSNNRRKMDP